MDASHTTALRFTVEETLQLLKLSRSAIYQRIAAGALRTTKDGARTFITRGEIERYLTACEAQSSSTVQS